MEVIPTTSTYGFRYYIGNASGPFSTSGARQLQVGLSLRFQLSFPVVQGGYLYYSTSRASLFQDRFDYWAIVPLPDRESAVYGSIA